MTLATDKSMPKPDSRKTKAPDPVRAIGHTSVILVVNMNQFIVTGNGRSNYRRFERIRGTDRFAKILQNHWSQKFHTVDRVNQINKRDREDMLFMLTDPDWQPGGEPQMSTDETGFVTGIFRHNMLTDYSAPEYQLNKDAMHFDPLLAQNYQFRRLLMNRIWKQWDIFVRPTVTGMFVIRLTRKYDRMQAIDRMARDVLDLQQSFDLSGALLQYDKLESDPIYDHLTAEDKQRNRDSVDALLAWLRVNKHNLPSPGYIPVQWQLALEVCHRFLRAVGFEIVPDESKPNYKIQLQESPYSVSAQLHDSYVIYHMDEITTIWSRKDPYDLNEHSPWHVFPKDLKFLSENANYAKKVAVNKVKETLVNMVEGAMLSRREDNGDMTRYFPSHSREYVDSLFGNDTATWDDELCILTSRTALLMPSHASKQSQLYISTLPATDTTSVMYLSYWEAFERMIEFIAEVRVLAQLLERDSLMISQEFVDKLRDIRYEMLQGTLEIKPSELTQQVEEAANLVRLVAVCQSLSTPHVWSRAEYAVDKAEYLLEEMRISRFLDHAERNVTSLTRFVDHIDELYLAEQSERSNQSTNRVSTLLGVVSLSVIVFSLPSFWRDSQEIQENLWINQYLTPDVISALALMGSVLAIGLGILGIGLVIHTLIFRRRNRKRRNLKLRSILPDNLLS